MFPSTSFNKKADWGRKKYENFNILETKSSFVKKYKAFLFLENTFPLLWLNYTALKVSGITFKFNCTTNICNFYFLSFSFFARSNTERGSYIWILSSSATLFRQEFWTVFPFPKKDKTLQRRVLQYITGLSTLF